jgi:predicted acetyltransferase
MVRRRVKKTGVGVRGDRLDAADAAAVERILGLAFGLGVESSRAWLSRIDPANLRIARRGAAVAGALTLLPMGQWFGGRRVPMTGVAAVAVAPEHRGDGVGLRLMRDAVAELHAAGVALSALYPATEPLYRRAGYERAGSRFEIRVPARALAAAGRAAPLRPAEAADDAAIRDACRTRAAACPGNLDRNAYIWERVREPRGEIAQGYVVEGPRGRIDGYVFFTQKRGDSYQYELNLTDLVALSPAAARRLLDFFADHRSMVTDVVWTGSAADAILAHLVEPSYAVKLLHSWMLRIVDVPAALSARGYPPGLKAEVSLAVSDDLVPANADRFVLEVAGGRGAVRRGGPGRVALDVRGFAPLYSGHLAPRALRVAGLLDGPERDLDAAAAIFAGPAPWMSEMF